ncbi:MAG TPA: hypothetical protein RMH85_12380 [Polyangiaceae bacterium LLY-WYZ-15_(1-7)]|nr:hypothetical protein [Myxococcales bacterium]MBJ71323.1 hypothetical protein [Sandaracinus sp.]HJK89714.1 hypothetical protein [Polyangiaceae bacterium LLY-WYZ-15_(1-7)]HJL02263.1 hypothetical protein [Polyangiaceae bacterium LLY-WYZ-15_(1-7)]HJL09293.1 hypothetical protein [Polyangiaceae bacterium LLY-WYZ-15_(1-7)]
MRAARVTMALAGLLLGSCVGGDGNAGLEVRLRLPPMPAGTTVWVAAARGSAFTFDRPWIVEGDQRLESLAVYPEASDGADLSFSVLAEEPGELRLRVWLCPPEGMRAEPCDTTEPGVFPHYWLLFERPFFEGRAARWHAAAPSAFPDESGWREGAFWEAEPALPWDELPPLRAPCDPAAGECMGPTRIDGCRVWVPACRQLSGGNEWPPGQRFCVDDVHDADDC